MTDAPETVGDLGGDVTVRYYGDKYVIHLDAVDCPTQKAGRPGTGSTRKAGVLFDDRPICKDCQELYAEDETNTLVQEGGQ